MSHPADQDETQTGEVVEEEAPTIEEMSQRAAQEETQTEDGQADTRTNMSIDVGRILDATRHIQNNKWMRQVAP